jgi:ribose transport system substrate-binding protein
VTLNTMEERGTFMRKSRLTLAGGILAASALTLAACASGADTTPAGGDDTGDTTAGETTDGGTTYTVYALLPQGNDQPYGTTYLPPMQAKAAELGIELIITNSEYDADKQASECEVAVAAQPDGIILWPAVGDTVRPCLEAANNAGIPVWITNSDLFDEDKPLSRGYSGPDTYGQGVASAEMMCEFADGAEVGIIQINGLTGNSTAIDRRNGFVDTIEANCPNVTILAEQPGNWNKDDSQIAASEMLTAVGIENVGGIYAADDTMVAGAIDALKARGLNPADFLITSIGNTFLGNPLVVSGELGGTVFQSSSWDGENSVVGIYRVLTGDIPEGDRVTLFMPDVKVTAANATDPAVSPEW